MIDFNKWLKYGGTIQTSGTTGKPKCIVQTPEKISAANKAAVESQNIKPTSKIYTVCKMDHAGGLLAQTLPGWSVGAHIDIEPFNPYRFNSKIENYTHTHLVPDHCRILMKTKDFYKLDLSNVWITCGSDPVSWDIIEAFVKQGATFMTNWGMSEIGPCAINTVFRNMDDVVYHQEGMLKDATLLGTRFYCDWKIEDEQLFVKGDICVYDGWYATGDRVVTNSSGTPYYKGRLNGS